MTGRREGLLALCLFVLLSGVYLLSFSGRYHASDEMSMLAATDSLARRGAWDTELIRWMGEQQGSFGPDGHLYSRKGIGATLAALPLYWLALQSERIGNVQAAMLTGAWATALTAVWVALYVRRLGYGQGVSLGTGLAFGLATMVWPYARTLFSEPLSGLGLMMSAYFLLRTRDGGGWASPLLAGVGLGLALLARLNNAIAAPFLGLALLAYLGRRGDLRRVRTWAAPVLLFAGPVAAALAVTGWYNWLRFGDPLVTGYLPQERFSAPFFQGLYGLVLSPGKGLLWYNPILFAALAAWPALARRHRPEALLAAALVLGHIAFYAPWYLWWGGHSWGPRFLVTILPFAALPLAPVLDTARRSRLMAAGLALLVIVSAAVQLLGVLVDFNVYLEDVYGRLGLYHPATLFDPVYSPLVRTAAYLRPENLDLAWARGGAVDPLALTAGAGVVLLAGLALWSAWRSPFATAWSRPWTALPVVLVAGALFMLARSAPSGDVARAAHLLTAIERPGEVVALADPGLTEPFQNAYDGRLWTWGARELPGEEQGLWTLGKEESDPAAARFAIGTVVLALNLPPGTYFDVARLPLPIRGPGIKWGGLVELVVAWQSQQAIEPGNAVPVVLVWRALAPLDTSYTLFVQALGTDGAKAGQIDRLPCGGGCPTTSWRPGDVIGEWIDVPIGADVTPGRYELIAGMYDLATGERLPVQNSSGNLEGGYFPFSGVEVRP